MAAAAGIFSQGCEMAQSPPPTDHSSSVTRVPQHPGTAHPHSWGSQASLCLNQCL